MVDLAAYLKATCIPKAVSEFATRSRKNLIGGELGGVLGAEPIAPRGVPSVRLVLPIGDDGIAGVLQPAAGGDLRGACKRPVNSDCLHPGFPPVVDSRLDAAWGIRRSGVKAESHQWVNSDNSQ